MKRFLFSMLGKGDVSVGSTCILIMVFVYSGLMIAAFVIERTLPVTGTEFALIIGAIYGIKQTSNVANTYYQQRGKVPSADISD